MYKFHWNSENAFAIKQNLYKFHWNPENAFAIKQNFTIYFNLPDR